MFKTWHRYVDNIFAVIPNTHIQDAIKLLYIQDNSLKFTLETEIDGQLPILDLKITRKCNRITFGIYNDKKCIKEKERWRHLPGYCP